jgi:hypothetical protein
VLRRRQEGEFDLMSQKEFQPEQDRHRRTRRISAGELGQQRQGAANVRRLLRWQLNAHAAQVATLAHPGGC